MSGDLFKVQFIRSKTCSLFIPEKWARRLQDIKKLETNSAIKIIYDCSKIAYFGWQQSNNFQDNVVGMNAIVATNLGLKEGDHISLVVCNSPAHLKSVQMSPLSSDDLEMIESSSGLLQSTLLNQVRVVWKGQLLTAWISNALPIILQVGNMEPNVNVGRLEELTEVVIGDPINSKHQALQSADPESTNVLNGIVTSGKSLANSVVKAVKGKVSQDNYVLVKNDVVSEKSQYIFRVHPLHSNVPEHGPLDTLIPGPSFHNLFHFLKVDKKSFLCKVTKLVSRKDSSPKSENFENQTSNTKGKEKVSMYVRVFGVDLNSGTSKSYYNTDRRCIYMSNNLRITLNLEIGSRVILSEFDTGSPAIRLDRVDLYPHYGLKCFDLGRNLKHFIDQMPDGFLLSTNMLITIPTEKGFVDAEVRLLPTTLTHILLQCGQSLHERDIHVIFEKRVVNERSLPATSQCIPRQYTDQLHVSHLNSLIHEGVTSMKLALGLSELLKSCSIMSNVLLLGMRGCGKTSTARAICSLLQDPPHFIHSSIIKCRPLKGKTVESLHKHIQNAVDDCVYHQPSILIIDDVESIAGVPDDHDQNSQASAYFNRVARMLLHLIKCLQESHSVAIIATAPSLSSVSPSLIPPRGIHIFNTQLELPELSRVDRQEILEKLLNQKLVNREIRDLKCLMSLEECAIKTEGYCCQDLSDLVDKATLAACIREALSSKKPIIESCDILQALSDSTPMLLRGVSLHKDSAFGWDDIGGLKEVKTELKEVFEWPVKFPELFQNSPLRQQSGLLLYGAPGTGKTMLAAAVARECGLNFICVKGPELLSKYIGASEEAVRNVFFKAQSAKPCVLFFDEFDSLAPRRGHDNTGVTDRVVNQLLTQLDGVESLVGVWVLAATSRPDLLDPALLRPGRLDRSVLCPLPDKENRFAILEALSRKMNLDVTVDFTQIAAESGGFTGADLQAILYSAQLNAVQEKQSEMSVSDENCPSREQISFTVTQSHIDLAAKSTRPSLTVQERSKYLNIFRKFGAEREKTTQSLLDSPLRATLA